MKLPKLAAFDLDGTLLTSEHRLSNRVIKTVRALAGRGCIPVIVTGRNYQGVKPHFDRIGLSGYLITSNGAMICRGDTGDIVKEWPLADEITSKVIRIARDRNLHFQGFTNEAIYYESKGEEAEFYESVTGLKGELAQFDNWKSYGFIKALVIGPPSRVSADWPELYEIRDMLQEDFGNRLFAVFSRPFYLDLMNGACSKGEALKTIAAELKVKPEEIIAFGDAENDLTMFDLAGISVAMKNAPEAVKTHCSYITEHTNDEDGVADFIETCFL